LIISYRAVRLRPLPHYALQFVRPSPICAQKKRKYNWPEFFSRRPPDTSRLEGQESRSLSVSAGKNGKP